LLACYIFTNKFVRNFNEWYYNLKFGNKEYPLPPGDMGWPIIGNLWHFFKSFSSGQPDTFIENIVLKYISFYFLMFSLFLSSYFHFKCFL
jgi:ent-kaurenoic acid monooxygenase